MNLEALALAVDDQVRVPAAERGYGRLYAVRCQPDPCAPDGDATAGPATTAGRAITDGGANPDGDDEPPPSCPAAGGLAGPLAADGVVLELLAEGEARTLPQNVRPPEGVRAIALTSGVWVAPMEDEGSTLPPSRHPDRRRAHLTVVIGPEHDRDAVDVSVLRYGDGSPTVMRGGIGLIHQRMLRCWSRRPDAPWSTQRPPAAAA